MYLALPALYHARIHYRVKAMQVADIKKLIEASIEGAEATVTEEGGKYTAVVVSAAFEGKTMIAEQKMVYAAVNEHIQSGAIHALTIKAYTPEEYSKI